MPNRKIYAGIGSRKTPPEILEIMTQIATKLERRGWLLRSGGADGADTAFEDGVHDPANKIIYLPWKGFNGRQEEPDFVWKYTSEHEKIAHDCHPRWQFLKRGAKMLHTRNVAQVLGDDCKSPATVIICWTPDGKSSGGTGQALRIGRRNGVIVFNLHDQETLEKFINLDSKNEQG